jgi:hypothetical protein
MLMLGDILALSKGATGAFQKLLSEDLISSIQTAAEAEGVRQETYVRIAVSEFARDADAEDWTRLMSHLRDSDDPARVCLQAMVERRLRGVWAERRD